MKTLGHRGKSFGTWALVVVIGLTHPFYPPNPLRAELKDQRS